MSNNAILVDVEWCSGCHSCEVACQMIKGLPPEQFGIKIAEIGPWKLGENNWQLMYAPALTKQCDMCAERVELGMQPMCVKHCQAKCLEFGTIDELAAKLASKPHAMLLTAV
jgi:Fe-S-cluster-containing dehydrogenase component